MAATADNWRQSDIILGAGKLYIDVGIPVDGARLATDSGSLTPDSASSAIHMGATQAGATLTLTSAFTDYPVDEFPDPWVTSLDVVGMKLEGALAGILDLVQTAKLMPAVATYATASGYKQMTIGRKALTYTGVCIVAPRHDDPTKIVIAHIYKAVNKAGVQAKFGRKEMAFTPFNFEGYAVSTRTATDTIGNIWHTIT